MEAGPTMKNLSPTGYWVVTLSYNVSIVGKIWLTVMILLRVVILLLAGYPLYNEREVICITSHLGCSTECYDSIFPVSPMRYWLLQTVMVFLPFASFSVYVFHKVIRFMATSNEYRHNFFIYHGEGQQIEILEFRGIYVLQLVVRIVLELGFCVGQYFLYGSVVPNTFPCRKSPCSYLTDCFISKPTEKSFMMILMWCLGAASLILSLLDLISSCNPENIENQIVLPENDSLRGVSSETPAHTTLAVTSEPIVIYPGGPSKGLEKTDQFGNDHLITHRQAKTKESLRNL